MTTQTEYSLEKVGIFVIPNGTNEGNMESLCLSTVIELNFIKEYFDSFVKCVKQKLFPMSNPIKNQKISTKPVAEPFLQP